MKRPVRKLRCAIYTRKSSEEGLEMEFNSLDAQREAGLAYIQSQKSEGWILVGDRYDDGGFSGGSMERPGLQRLLRDVEAGRIDVIVVYKVDRLLRSLTVARIGVPADEIEDAVVAQVRHLLATPEIVARTWVAANAEGEAGVPEREVVETVPPSRRCGMSCSRPSRHASSVCWSRTSM
jgi:Resolvase, N terminal domain